MSDKVSRRNLLSGAALTVLGGLGISALSKAQGAIRASGGSSDMPHQHETGHGNAMMIGTVDHERNGFDPLQLLTDWDYGKVSTMDNGQTLREYQLIAVDKEIEIAPGIFFPAWTYNGRVPGPTIRCTEGDRI